ncbi:hypothetical protein KL905_004797 [Ogataea polymorpha]|nr:hypothetical protein KL937_004812 [Ogataea polymorpha]KAG7915749.1 hypothetical protein KL905_004797 [Ogataea polymorpha]KAG7931920.1 hypothetical protein KL904_004666 [Ogataea polymorpha]
MSTSLDHLQPTSPDSGLKHLSTKLRNQDERAAIFLWVTFDHSSHAGSSCDERLGKTELWNLRFPDSAYESLPRTLTSTFTSTQPNATSGTGNSLSATKYLLFLTLYSIYVLIWLFSIFIVLDNIYPRIIMRALRVAKKS